MFTKTKPLLLTALYKNNINYTDKPHLCYELHCKYYLLSTPVVEKLQYGNHTINYGDFVIRYYKGYMFDPPTIANPITFKQVF